ncbi:hypothetical protein B0I35DRAFT_222329 [Stachybotrys elegans]|uniref:Uncharacterized protein n=1 Tax=Stachybotrys elegans TaxID=80388 RepID=A0A8K0SSZ3_9HYPO|nr:hypothetical protein B0I35DRAFT_222329 [Stachybotrys elegans]
MHTHTRPSLTITIVVAAPATPDITGQTRWPNHLGFLQTSALSKQKGGPSIIAHRLRHSDISRLLLPPPHATTLVPAQTSPDEPQMNKMKEEKIPHRGNTGLLSARGWAEGVDRLTLAKAPSSLGPPVSQEPSQKHPRPQTPPVLSCPFPPILDRRERALPATMASCVEMTGALR